MAVIVLLKVGRVSHEGVPVTDVRAGIDQTLWLESQPRVLGSAERFLQVLDGGGKQNSINRDLNNVLRNPFNMQQ